jgi:hypothetical protein
VKTFVGPVWDLRRIRIAASPSSDRHPDQMTNAEGDAGCGQADQQLT